MDVGDETSQLLEAAWDATLRRRSFQPGQHRQNKGAREPWKQLGKVLAQRLGAGRSVGVPRLGCFTLLSDAVARGQSDARVPALLLLPEFECSTGLCSTIPPPPPSSQRAKHSALPLAAIAAKCGLTKDAVAELFIEVFDAVAAAVVDGGRSGAPVCLSLPPLGQLQCYSGRADFVFNQEFCRRVAVLLRTDSGTELRKAWLY